MTAYALAGVCRASMLEEWRARVVAIENQLATRVREQTTDGH